MHFPDATSSPTRRGKSGHKPFADMAFLGGTVHVLDEGRRVAQALAVIGDTIAAVGSKSEVEGWIGPETKIISTEGRAVLPGINDAHLHAVWYGAQWPRLMFESSDVGWHSRLLCSEQDRIAAIRKAWQELARLGITSYTEPGIGPGEDDGETGCFGTAVLETYASLAGSREQTARVTLLRLFGYLDGPSSIDDYRRGLETPAPSADSRWLSIPGVKIFADGIPPMRTAWTNEPYRDGGHGALLTGDGNEQERLCDFRTMVSMAHERGLQVAVHATGDRTIEEFISVVEKLGGAERLGHYVIHGDLITREQIERLKSARMGIALQPLIADQTADWLAQAVSEATVKQAWPMDKLVGNALNAILSSDAPVASPDWRRVIASAALQLERRDVVVDESILTELLRMYTAIPAIQDGAADWKGTLEVGKVADICVLEHDPLANDASALPNIEVDMTMVGGRIVHDRAVN
jgi:predicted amidohydrolase YtcJ